MKSTMIGFRETRLQTALLCAVAAIGAPWTAAAQQPPADTAEPASAAAESEAAEPSSEPAGELDRARRELEAARRDLEAAAREVARLSAQAAGPVVTALRRQWMGAGQRTMLGVAIEDAPEGAHVTAVSPGGPAAEAGIRIGDVLVSIDGEPLAGVGGSPSRTLTDRLSQVEPGTAVDLGLARNGSELDVSVATREREAGRFLFRERPRLRFESQPFADFFFGTSVPWESMELVSLSPELGAYFGTDAGLLVVRAPDDETLPLQDGDVILDISGREPSSPEHAMRILASFEPGETLRLTIMRRQQRETLEVRLPSEPAADQAP